MVLPGRLRAIAVIFGCALFTGAFAQSYPARPIKFVIQLKCCAAIHVLP